MQRQESSLLAADGTVIVYDEWRPTGQAHGVLVLCHGFAEHAGRYEHVIARLGELGVVVYAPDLRGHGRSDGKRAYLRDWSDYLDDLSRLFDVVTREYPGVPTFLLGHSMGGLLALSYALDHRAQLSGVALSGPAVDVTVGTPRVVIEIGKVVGRYFPAAPVNRLDATLISRDSTVVDKYLDDPLIYHGLVSAGLARGMILAAEQLERRLPELTVPLLLQHGREDGVASVHGTELVAQHAGSTDITVEIYDGLYHEIYNEPERERVLNDLVDWLRPRLQP